jgi:hypothetical protein
VQQDANGDTTAITSPGDHLSTSHQRSPSGEEKGEEKGDASIFRTTIFRANKVSTLGETWGRFWQFHVGLWLVPKANHALSEGSSMPRWLG